MYSNHNDPMKYIQDNINNFHNLNHIKQNAQQKRKFINVRKVYNTNNLKSLSSSNTPKFDDENINKNIDIYKEINVDENEEESVNFNIIDFNKYTENPTPKRMRTS